MEDTLIPSKIFVGNLSFQTSSEQLKAALPNPESALDVAVITDRETGRSRGFAFVEFDSDEAAETAIRELNDSELEGRRLRVNAADERPRPPRGGGGAPPAFGPPPPKPKGSRRGLRGRKRSLGR